MEPSSVANKTSLDLNETGPDSVRISRNKLGYYSGLAVVPNDVAIALGTGASVGKAGAKKGGSRYQESVAEWDFLEGEYWSRCDVGMWELHSCRPAAVRQARFCMLILFFIAFHVVHWTAQPWQPRKG